MKKISYLTLILSAFCFLTNCSTPKSTAEVKVTSNSGYDILGTESIGYGKNRDAAIENAKEQAFTNLLFRGIPGSSHNRAMVGNETSSKNQHKDYFDDFFNKKGYNKFVRSCSEGQYSRKDKSIKCNISINVKALRTDLEQNNIIRGFGL
ncbi:MAG: hypothetical protein CMD04_04185 [Flavobacteriales bacterium]|nr:hypothetical protein [Flavobacteriales bacterium]